jgi:vesicle-associated membrane protein 7
MFADEDTKRRVPFAFLEDVKSRFVLSCGEQAQTAIAFSLNETFGPVLKKQMVKMVLLCRFLASCECDTALAMRFQDYYNSNPQADQFSTVQSKIDDARNVMLDNIGNVVTVTAACFVERNLFVPAHTDDHEFADKLLSRGEKIELLVDKTESLNQSAFTFEKSVRCICH